MRLFYFVTDTYPAWRVDLAELFSVELKKLGLSTDWSMRRDCTGFWGVVYANKEQIYLPLTVESVGLLTPIIRRLGEFMSEIWIMLKLIFGARYDFIQVRDDRYTAAIFALIAARLRGSKFIYWVSFPFPENDLEKASLTKGIRSRIFRMRGHVTKWWLYKFMLPLADHVFVQTESMKLSITYSGLATDKMTAVPMAVSTKLYKWQRKIISEIDPYSLVYLGTFARSRHLETLIEAFSLVNKQMPQAKLYMVGRGDTLEDRLFLEELATALSVANNVIFTGFLPMERAWEIAAKAAVCVSPIYPSAIFLQGSPTKLYEYMALGRPVMANEHPEQLDALSASGAGICVAWGVESFATAIIKLLSNPLQAEEMGKKGPAWVAEHRRYDRVAAQVFRQYQKLMS